MQFIIYNIDYLIKYWKDFNFNHYKYTYPYQFERLFLIFNGMTNLSSLLKSFFEDFGTLILFKPYFSDVGHGGSASQKSIGGSGRNSFDHRSLGGDQTDASRRNVQQVRAFPDPEALVQANRRSLARVADQYPAGDRTSGSGRMRADQHLLEEQGRNPGGQVL